MEVGLYQKLSDLSPNEYELFKKNYIQIMHNDYLIDKHAAGECIELWHTIVKKVQVQSEVEHYEKLKETSIEKKVVPQNSISRENKKVARKIKVKKEYTHKDIEEICDRAQFYYKSNPLIRDYKKAFKWYKRAALLGHMDSMFQVGYMYENGRGVDKNIFEALKWYMRAAQLNHKGAMNNIGYLYENGEGVEKDIEQAISWYQKAMILGDDTAKNNIRRINNDSHREFY